MIDHIAGHCPASPHDERITRWSSRSGPGRAQGHLPALSIQDRPGGAFPDSLGPLLPLEPGARGAQAGVEGGKAKHRFRRAVPMANRAPFLQRASLLDQCSIRPGNAQEVGSRLSGVLPPHPARRKAGIPAFQASRAIQRFRLQAARR